jgi:hypothetical protein
VCQLQQLVLVVLQLALRGVIIVMIMMILLLLIIIIIIIIIVVPPLHMYIMLTHLELLEHVGPRAPLAHAPLARRDEAIETSGYERP